MKKQKLKIIKKLVTFTEDEWTFIQNYKHANKLKSDMEAIKNPILEKQRAKAMNFEEFFLNYNNQQIIKKLVDK